MILWLSIFIILFTIFISAKCFFDKLYDSSYVSVFSGTLAGAFLIASIFGYILDVTHSTPKNTIISQSIYSAEMNGKTQGNFILGTGAVSNQMYYYYYVNLDNGNKKLSQISANKVQINLNDQLSPQILTHKSVRIITDPTVLKLTKPFNVLYDFESDVDEDNTWSELIVPKNAITVKFDLNVK